MKTKSVIAVIPALSLAACASFGAGYEPILDGTPDPQYQSDLGACQALARNQKQFDQDTIGAVAAGGLFGALLADHEGSATVMEGLIGGALAGLVGGMFEAGDQRKAVVVECMKGRGHRVAG